MTAPTTRRQGDVAMLLLGTLAVAALTWLALSQSTVPELVSRWWFASAAATAIVLRLPRRLLVAGLGLVLVALAGAGTLAAMPLPLVLAVALGGALEVTVMVALLTGFEAARPRLATWADLRRWMLALSCASAVAAVTFTAGLVASSGSEPVGRALLWTAVTHATAYVLLLPLHLAPQRPLVTASAAERAVQAALLGLVAVTYVQAERGQPLSYLLLPLLVWASARLGQRVAVTQIYLVCGAVAVLSTTPYGPFGSVGTRATVIDMVASAQTFVAVAALTSVCFLLAMGMLADSEHRNEQGELRLAHLLDSASGTAFIATDLDGTITWFSPGAEQLTGYRAEDLLGRCDPMLLHDAHELLSRADEAGGEVSYDLVTGAVAAGALEETGEWTYLHRDGRRLTVAVSVSAARDDAGELQGFLSVVRDVTDRRAASLALEQALDTERESTRRLAALDRAKNDFVSAVSHDLRTPLTSIMGYTEILASDLDEGLTTRQRSAVSSIERNGTRLLHLVDDLLSLAQVQDHTAPAELAPTDLRHAVHDAADAVSHSAHQGAVTLRVESPEEPVLLLGDAHQLERMMRNLVGNAVKFTPAGGRVDVHLEVDGAGAHVTVRDTGVGIPLAEQDKLFERFYRASTATQHAIQGTGLGLAIVRSIARAHSAELELTSEPGLGTVIRVHLPLAPLDQGPREAGRHAQSPAT